MIPDHDLTVSFVQLALVLAVAHLLGGMSRRVGLPSLVGHMTTGVLLGPSVLGRILPEFAGWLFPGGPTAQHLLGFVAQLGVILMVALAAAELDTSFLRRKRVAVASVSACAFAIPFGLGVALAFILPAHFRGSGASTGQFVLLVGIALSVSAIPVIAVILADTGMLQRDVGQLILAAAAVCDMGAWIVLAFVSGSRTDAGGGAAAATTSAGLLIASVAVAIVVRPGLRRSVAHLERESRVVPFTTVVVCVVVAGAAVTLAMGLEAILGAFLVGLVIGRRRADMTRPLRTVVSGVLVPAFLATAGMRLHLEVFGRVDVVLIGIGVVAVAGLSKLGSGYLGGRLAGMSRRESVAVGAGLNARGAVEIVIAAVGLSLGVIGDEMYSIIVLVAVVTSMLAPTALTRTMRGVGLTNTERSRGASIPAESVTVAQLADPGRGTRPRQDQFSRVLAEEPTESS